MAPSAFVVTFLVVSLVVSFATADLCTDNDVRSLFTPCNSKTGLMESIEYFERICENPANGSGVTLKPPRATPCVKSCPSGTFYSSATLNCEPCGKGEFSNSGGEIINNFVTFPSRFATYCSPQPCSPWRVSYGGFMLDSGNQSVGQRHSAWYSGVDESVEVVLSTIIDVINPRGGKLIFQYRVESEKSFDGLQLFLNGSLVSNPDGTIASSRFFATGMHHTWRQAEVPLSPGRVEVHFKYSKDANQISDAANYAGADRAFLKDFTIEGVQMFAPKCTKCAPGEYADKKGSMDCRVCPRNTYSGAGSPGCTPCDDGSWAPVGSGMCFTKAACTADDYVASYEVCKLTDNKPSRNRQWKLVNTRCIETASSMPQSGLVDCALCPSGMYTDSSLNCVACPVGQALIGSTCTACQPGTAAVPIVDYSGGFDFLGGNLVGTAGFSMSCNGLCSACADGTACVAPDSGFELASFKNHDDDNTVVGIRQSLSNGYAFTSRLSYKFTLVTDGSVSIKYTFVRQGAGTNPVPDVLSATVSVDGYEYEFDKYFVSPGGPSGTFSRQLSGPASYELVFTVAQSGYIAQDDTFAAAILSMVVEGDAAGGSAKCSACKAGHYCPGSTNHYVPCSLGTAQPRSGQSSCDTCSGNSISKEVGAKYCQNCAYGTYASTDHQVCVNTCDITFGGNRYDFTELRGVVFGPLLQPGTRTDLTEDQMDAMNLYRFFVSPCSFVNQDKSRGDVCSISYGSLVEDAYSCQRLNANRSYSAGDDLHFGVNSASQQFNMRITGGDMCHRANVARSTNITFLCDPNQEGYGTMQYISESPQCQYNFLFTSKYGCPVCTADSFTKVQSDCGDDGISSVAYFKKPFASQCHGGFVPPAAVNSTCEKCKSDFYDLVWSDCKDGKQTQSYVLKAVHKGCVDDGKVALPPIAHSSQSCTKIDAKIGANGFTFTLVFIVGCVSLLFYALYTLYSRHTRLQVEYQRLSTNSGEMADMGDESEDDADRLERNNQSVVPVEDK